MTRPSELQAPPTRLDRLRTTQLLLLAGFALGFLLLAAAASGHDTYDGHWFDWLTAAGELMMPTCALCLVLTVGARRRSR